jgi:FkbH-like protein
MTADRSSPSFPATDLALVLHIGSYYLDRRRPDDARALLTPLLASLPTVERERVELATLWARLSQSYTTRRQLEQATEALQHAQSLADVAAIWRAAAALATARADHAEAQGYWRRVTAADPTQMDAWLALARASESAGAATEAMAAYLEAARQNPDHATTLSIAERLVALAAAVPVAPAAAGVRVAILGSSTLDHVRGYLEIACRLAGLAPQFYVGPFDQYAQDILDPASALYAFAPDVIVLAIHGRTLFAPLYDTLFDLDVDARHSQIADAVEHVTSLLAQLTVRSGALVLLHTFATPQHSPLGTLDYRDPLGQTQVFHILNDTLAAVVRERFPSVHLVDEDRVYGRIGKRNVTDPRMWLVARISIGEAALGAVTAEYMRFIKAAKGRSRKCLVLDLDNTLWGGVVGEDGPTGIALGQEAPGSAYRAFQEAILGLWKRGVILAINSKNNEQDALEVLERHPEMILRPQHFAAMRINWLDKATNLRAIAEELNIGIDSMVFIDDNPAECALMRSALPEVLTVQLPADPALYRRLLLDMTDFDTLALTEEDRQRGMLYSQRRERQHWESQHADALDGYLAELGLVVEVARADDFAIPRIAQLIGKTNQFNLTTRRHTESDVRRFAAVDDHIVLMARVRDRFGDHGLVGAAILIQQDSLWIVDTLLLSCRVLGRGVETAVLSAIVAAAREDGTATLRGLFIPTSKNEPARDFYARHGFTHVADHEGTELWELDLRQHDVSPPEWLVLHTEIGVRTPAERVV